MIFSIEAITGTDTYAGIYILFDGTNSVVIQMGNPNSAIYMTSNGSTLGMPIDYSILPPIGTLWYIKIDFIASGSCNVDITYSTDFVNWNSLFGYMWGPEFQSLPAAIAVGPYFSGAAGTPTTGTHIGNIIVQDMPPASPNCQISNAYVATSGQAVVFFFETTSGNTPVLPTALNYAPAVFRNGALVALRRRQEIN